LTVLVSGVQDGLVDQALVDKLIQELAAQGARVPRITVQHVAVIPKTAAGKAPLIKANAPRLSTRSGAPASGPAC
jgi:hypothetical protein